MVAMAVLRSRRLEKLLGASLDVANATHIRSLVTNAVPETFDLEFKSETYGRSDKAKRDLAGDVAALANTAGGLIVLGVDEDDQATATSTPEVDLSDDEKRRMQQIVASGVAPMPDFEILAVPGGTAGRGFYLIAVPRSPAAPHAVLVDQGFRYPRRNGATTRYLSESEVAAAYRDRFNGAEAQTRRIEVAEKEALSRLAIGRWPWLVVTVAPQLPGSLEIDEAAARTFRDDFVGLAVFGAGLSVSTSFGSAVVGPRRLIALDSVHEHATWAATELHTDGTATYAMVMDRDPSADDSLMPGDPVPVSGWRLTAGVLTGLTRCAAQARDRAQAGGNLLVRARLLTDGRPFEIDRAAYPSRGRTATAETVASIDGLADPGPDLVMATARVVDEIAQACGVAELGLAFRHGHLRSFYWPYEHQAAIQSWAARHGIVVDPT